MGDDIFRVIIVLLSIEWNSIRQGGLAHGIVIKLYTKPGQGMVGFGKKEMVGVVSRGGGGGGQRGFRGLEGPGCGGVGIQGWWG